MSVTRTFIDRVLSHDRPRSRWLALLLAVIVVALALAPWLFPGSKALGYRIRRLFVGVFVVGSALAGLGGVLWGLFQQNVIPQLGAQVNVLIFIVIIIGGLGSTMGCLIGALLVGLMANYTGFLAPKVALFSNILLMVLVLLWRPQGIYPVANR